MYRCRQCKERKIRVWHGQRHARGSRVFVDSAGKWWNGYQCPDCKYAPKTSVENEEDITPVGFVVDPVTERKCRGCRKCLPTSRYFFCYACKGSNEAGFLPYAGEEYGYGFTTRTSPGYEFKLGDWKILL